ncbi:uncharacterized protein EV420DRAFT_1689055 [Desarmillaria tabescens]|uniref:Uncharacterized protein n=1 Tax=Armillaria tabescens TaxID=1929756 RepID=A0AA39KAF8_ARMTA|nr:uncharacterized protein EV420DRAFT_1689055 [Desarmillaria tabescens]KAK0457559.1 hypothetical protein EV420DRAFT_1689055 [Desarmillaria tabescens]
MSTEPQQHNVTPRQGTPTESASDAAPSQPPQAVLDLTQVQEYFSTNGVLDVVRLLEGYRDLSKTLRDTQLQVNALIDAKRLLELSAASSTKSKGRGSDSGLTAEQEKTILQFGKRCIVTIDLWPEDAEIFEERPSANAGLILSAARYASAESEQDALYAEIYSALKENFHFCFAKNYGPAKKLFLKSASDGRSTFLNRVKNDAFHTIFGALVPSASNTDFDPLTDPHCLDLLGYRPSNKTYSSLPPILWEDGVKGDPRSIFRSTTLMKILFVIFYGGASLKQKSTKKAVKSKQTNAFLWKLTETSPGTMAYAATVARFVLSGDECFDKRGGRSGINYASDYYQYKRTIIEAISTSHMKQTITAYNRFLFDEKPSRLGTNQRGTSCDDDNEFIELQEAFADVSDAESDTPMANDAPPDAVMTVTADPEVQELIQGVKMVNFQLEAPSNKEQEVPEIRRSRRGHVVPNPGDTDLTVSTETDVTQAKGCGHGAKSRGKAGSRGRGCGTTQTQTNQPQHDARPTRRGTRADTQWQVSQVQEEAGDLENDDVYG